MIVTFVASSNGDFGSDRNNVVEGGEEASFTDSFTTLLNANQAQSKQRRRNGEEEKQTLDTPKATGRA
ncbi:hypothetical protein KFK09_019715 [Dendrobium nobile]|uniref:Uncharacterized protein n=1 Tax=Dendrobium nobile TaxID=94219 RepID=A0A8T3ARS0_DENNO|nr:hypothetical protein KFK09_019715 [Dendrobium nobile]